MSFHYCILGAGRQGVAIAYDLIRNGDAARVTLVDLDPAAAQRGAERLRALLPDVCTKIEPVAADVADPAAARRVMTGTNVVVSAAPYRLNAALTDAAIAARASFCDLGGNTDVVRAQLARDAAARAAGVSVVPDCGLAPGLGNHLAAHGIARFDEPEHVHIRCGGLPQERVGPLQYKLVFNFDGLINEYSGFGEFLRNGAPARIPALTELEDIEFDPPLGRCEAAVTSGGTSTCPQTFLGRLKTYDYKTVRYPGHFAIIRALFELGCFEDALPARNGQTVSPRTVMRRLFEERLAYPDVRDLVVLRTTVIGRRGGTRLRIRYDLFDRHDPATGFTAMERTTAFPAALVAFFQARKGVAPGARPLELSVPADQYVAELPQHDIHIRVTESTPAD